ncbi:MAG: GAF domain-containing protein [Pseudolabrys sp.]
MLERMMSERLRSRSTFEDAVETVLHDVVALHGAEYGDVQLPVGDELWLVAQLGLTAPFLKTFMRVRPQDGCACGRALRDRRTIVIPDVEVDPEYAAFRRDAQAAGYRGVQSTPLIASNGALIGVVSTLFARAHEPTVIEMQTLTTYGVSAANHLCKLLGGDSLAAKAERMSARLRAEFGLDEAPPAMAGAPDHPPAPA